MSERGGRDVVELIERFHSTDNVHDLWRYAREAATELRASRATIDNLRQRYDIDVFGLDGMLNEARAEADAARAERDALRLKLDVGVRGWAYYDTFDLEWHFIENDMTDNDGWRPAVLIFTDDNEKDET